MNEVQSGAVLLRTGFSYSLPNGAIKSLKNLVSISHILVSGGPRESEHVSKYDLSNCQKIYGNENSLNSASKSLKDLISISYILIGCLQGKVNTSQRMAFPIAKNAFIKIGETLIETKTV